MSSESVSTRRDRLMLAADGCLITAGTFGLMIGVAFGLDALGVAPLGEPHGGGLDLLLSVISWLLQVGGFVVGPVIVWWLHRRQFSKTAILGLIAGFPIGGALVLPVAMLGALFGWFVGLFTKVEYAGAIAYLVLIVIAFLAVLVWLVIDAFRDLSATPREHVSLDVGRLVAFIVVAVFAGVVIAKTIAGEDAFEAFAFVLAAGVEGAAVITAADVIVRVLKGRTGGHPERVSS